ncbi:DUF2141 domain-containing protein [Novosphingobium mangrovi (ex Huang et al. 2023)]|uniref:DUF2141 domain-containing protein n=1 Tax=Novosphingobium mangrovi (ex Huang et al. 2023) TaxID=2976432 RepID=A0ABT2HZX4_9SPHN|nr:DUF2141 domain-containing protein [Novosphingobium mangrovi (ex Huang et al. 2023)]MCT2398106.1 DUF2141 domain-containing protein [Novosphingobium mangrovi (ex Huang et al. 2023)]
MQRLALLLALPFLIGAGPAGAPVEVAVTGIATARGRVHVDICPESRFTRKDCPWSAEAPARAGTTTVTVPGVPPGRYAAQAYWDANDNGKADRNFIGMPLEPVGFSNDVRVKLSRPKFAAAAFEHGNAKTPITFAVHKIP